MTLRKFYMPAVAVSLLCPLLLIACGDAESDGALSRADVEEIVGAAVSEMPEPEVVPTPQPGITREVVEDIVKAAVSAISQPEPGLTRDDVAEIVREAIGEIPDPAPGLTLADIQQVVDTAVAEVAQPEPRLTREEVQRIVQRAVAYIPLKSDPAEYTKFFVENAITRYESEGLVSTLAHYNRVESIDGQWYIFIVDENDKVIGHYDPLLIGEDLNGPIGTDANGYNFAPEMLAATEDGKWVSYVYQNPERTNFSPGELSDVDLKNAWVVRHDGLLFGSGWYVDVDRFTQDIVAALADTFGSVGLQGTIELLGSGPGDVLGGAAASAVSYNASGIAQGEWSMFIVDANGAVVLHLNPDLIGSQLEELLGPGVSDIDADGAWLTSESMRIWAVDVDGWVFEAGWRDDGSGS